MVTLLQPKFSDHHRHSNLTDHSLKQLPKCPTNGRCLKISSHDEYWENNSSNFLSPSGGSSITVYFLSQKGKVLRHQTPAYSLLKQMPNPGPSFTVCSRYEVRYLLHRSVGDIKASANPPGCHSAFLCRWDGHHKAVEWLSARELVLVMDNQSPSAAEIYDHIEHWPINLDHYKIGKWLVSFADGFYFSNTLLKENKRQLC